MRPTDESVSSVVVLLRVAVSVNAIAILSSAVAVLVLFPLNSPLPFAALFFHLIGIAACALAFSGRADFISLAAAVHMLFGLVVTFALMFFSVLAFLFAGLFANQANVQSVVSVTSMYAVFALYQFAMFVVCIVVAIIVNRQNQTKATAPVDDRGRVGEHWL
ncbi:MAG: hypothetical protein AAGI68_10170 [Planctomycetota bacterium]